ncbi:MAG: 6-phosphofructokinase [Phycisphaeraceae bacterium]|nr:6-phosphofructokinase [Phycisphaeraceae bacterium]
MSQVIKANAVIGQSGGPTAVINQSMVGVIEGLKANGFEGKIFGSHHAVAGMIKGDFIELQDIAQDRLNRIAATPSAALGSSRDKPDTQYCKNVLKVLEAQNIHYFFYIGGNDSSDTCRIVNELAKAEGYELRAFHCPKTIDNDLVCNDHTPGFGSAAKFVAQAFMGDNLDNAALPGVKINVVMGRHAGFLTAASILGRRSDKDGPHLVYVPESRLSVDKIMADVDRTFKKYGRCVMAVSEGIHDENGDPLAAKLAQAAGEEIERDSHGNVQLSGSGALGDFISKAIKSKLGIARVRADTLGYLQRSFAGCVSEVDQREARGTGYKAAELAMSGDIDGSIAIQRLSDDPYQVTYARIELSDVAAKTKTLDPKYIIDDCNIDKSFKTYLAPIVGPIPTIETLF